MISTTIGFIGIGNMGAPMVRRLAGAGLQVLIHDARSEAAAPFRDAAPQIRVAGGPRQIGADCRIVVTMLPDSKAVRAAVMGDGTADGFAETLRPGSVVIDMSSSFPLDTRALGEELAGRGIGLVDAPVSGGVPKAVSGTLAIMAGGDPVLIDDVQPVLEAMGSVHRTGQLGSGHAMKALNNYVSAAGLVAACEALVIGQRFGLDGQVMTRVLNASTGRNNTTENKVERYMLSGRFDSGFALALMEKDVGMARALAEKLGIGAEELALVGAILGKALERLGPHADHTALYDYVSKYQE
ncbi:MAG: NAD(P)-dependent oxidoreductase [Hyphomicrobiaceae bacterium]|nr:NAD(P)-dependent oxidoreductase [Hyphomicrobiaceae bacterium]